jgi:hypothetical protein
VGTLDIVDLSVDGPPAGAPGGNVASGNALKVSFDPTTWTNPEAVRLYSRPFTDIQAGEVYTFAANIATDITDVTNAPNILMAMSSPLGAKAMGYQLSRLQFGPSDPEYVATGGTVLDAYQQDIVPLASDGWQTVSVNYSPPLTPAWLDLNGDNNFDQADLDLIADIFGNPTSAAYAGWTDELATAHCALRVSAHEDATSPFAVWIDNLRVYRSAYELDLGLEKTAIRLWPILPVLSRLRSLASPVVLSTDRSRARRFWTMSASCSTMVAVTFRSSSGLLLEVRGLTTPPTVTPRLVLSRSSPDRITPSPAGAVSACSFS